MESKCGKNGGHHHLEVEEEGYRGRGQKLEAYHEGEWREESPTDHDSRQPGNIRFFERGFIP